MVTIEHRTSGSAQPVQIRQYTLADVLGIWASAAIPMAVLAWGVAPRLAGAIDSRTSLIQALILCLATGMLWQFLLVLTLVRHEQGSLRWSTVKDALWLHRPRSPRTGRRSRRLWWVLIPMVLAIAAEEFLPTLPTPATRDLGLFVDSPAGQAFLSRNWTWLGLLVAMFVLNTVVGEELLFRGLLLPRMQGVFGRWDWLANGVLFAVYHLHVPWVMPQALIVDTVALAYLSRRYRSALLGIAAHSAQSVFLTILIVGLVLK